MRKRTAGSTKGSARTGGARKRATKKASAKKASAKKASAKGAAKKGATRTSSPRKSAAKGAARKPAATSTPPRGRAKTTGSAPGAGSVLAQLETMGAAGGTLRLSSHDTLDVTSLDKVFFPKTGHTKGDIMRWYARVAPMLLPLIADRPLVLKRFPNGVTGPSFFQQKASDDPPAGVRVETIVNDQGERQLRYVGGDLATLLYTVQLGNVSVDPWHSRVGSLDFADYMILDLDPGAGATFQRVIDVARWVHDELETLGLHGALKTSGSSGLHIYVPLPARTTDETSRDFAEIIAGRVARAHPKEATVERSVKARARGTVYVDYLQNVKAKTVAAPYALRARPDATISTPLRWEELDARLDPLDFNLDTVPARLEKLGDIWGPVMRKPNSFARALEALGRRRGGREGGG